MSNWHGLDDTQQADLLKALGNLLDLIEEGALWVPSCDCGWHGGEWKDEADARAEAWAHAPCSLPKATEGL